MVPHGFRFNPTDEELIQVLDRKVSGHEMPLHFIVQANVYDREPQDLDWSHNAALRNDERYYYFLKENDSREVVGRGWWKATSHVKKVCADENVVGYKRPMTFHRFKNSKDRNRKSAIKTNWIMHEYSLESKSTEWRLCRIKYKGKPSVQEEMESFKQSYNSLKNAFEASAGTTSAVDHMMQLDSQGEQQQQEYSTLLPSDNTNHGLHHYYEHDQQLPQSHDDPYDHQMLPSHETYFMGEQGQYYEENDDQYPFSSLWTWKY